MCTGGEVFDEVIWMEESHKLFTEWSAAIIIKQVLEAIAYCHERSIVHRDLKPENLLFDKPGSDVIKVVDFGTSAHFNED